MIVITAILLASALAGAATAQEGEGDEGADDAGIQVSDGVAEGRWISLEFQNDTGRIDDLEVDGLRYFSSIRLPGAFQMTQEAKRLLFTGDSFQVTIHDDPRGVVRFDSENETFTLSPGWGVATFQREEYVELTYNHNTAYLSGADRQNRMVLLTQGTFFRVGPDAGVLEPMDGEEDPILPELDALAAQGQVAAWGRIGPSGIDLLPLARFDHESQLVRDLHHRLALQSLPRDARLFVFEIESGHMDPDALKLRHYEKMLSLLVPGDDIPAKASLEELLGTEGDAGYWAQDGLNGIRIVVALGPDETQGLEVIGTTATVPPGIAVGLLMGALSVVGGTGYFFWDRWRMRRPW